jgi:hypothetical protein
MRESSANRIAGVFYAKRIQLAEYGKKSHEGEFCQQNRRCGLCETDSHPVCGPE